MIIYTKSCFLLLLFLIIFECRGVSKPLFFIEDENETKEISNGSITPFQPNVMVDRSVVNVKDFGARGDGRSDDTKALREAFKHKYVILPEGTYVVTPDLMLDVSPYARNCVFKMHSNMHLKGIGKVVIKIKNDFSSRSKPKYFNMFMSNTDDTDISFENIVFDMNGENNLISLNNKTEVFGIYHTSALIWSYNPKTLQGSVDGLKVINCTFRGGPGTNAIVLGFFASKQQNRLSNNVVIRSCNFIESGFDTSDFTYVYSWAQNVLIEDCRFIGPTKPARKDTGIAAELHGSNSTFRNNIVDNLHIGVLVGESKGVDVENVEVYSNKITTFSTGILVWRDGITDHKSWVRNVKIYSNTISLIDGTAFNNLRYGINCSVPRNLENVKLFNNYILNNCSDVNFKTSGIYFGSTMNDAVLDNLSIYGNKIKNFTFGITNGDLQKGLLGFISITNNKIENNTNGFVHDAIGIRIIRENKESLRSIELKSNEISNVRDGIYLKGFIGALGMDDSNKIRNVKNKLVTYKLQVENGLH